MASQGQNCKAAQGRAIEHEVQGIILSVEHATTQLQDFFKLSQKGDDVCEMAEQDAPYAGPAYSKREQR
jgi:hypothetical protein